LVRSTTTSVCSRPVWVAGTEAERRFTAALALNERMQAPLNLALTQLEHARMLLARGSRADRLQARDLLDAALNTYTALDLDYQAGKVRAILAGPQLAGRRRARAAYPDGLSEREVEVLRLIAAGKSNPEVAATLVISRYTVERHVNHILAKTGAANRRGSCELRPRARIGRELSREGLGREPR